MYEWRIKFDLWHRKEEKRVFEMYDWFWSDTEQQAVNQLLDQHKEGKYRVCFIHSVTK